MSNISKLNISKLDISKSDISKSDNTSLNPSLDYDPFVGMKYPSLTSFKSNTSFKTVSDTTVNIAYLPKDKLIFALWQAAKYSKHLDTGLYENIELLTIEQVREDIRDKPRLDYLIYFDKVLYIEIDNDQIDVELYNSCNGAGLAEKIIKKLKLEELQRCILRYYTY